MNDNIRTLRDFVEDMISDGKSLKDTLAVAHSTRWKDKKEEIKKLYSEYN